MITLADNQIHTFLDRTADTMTPKTLDISMEDFQTRVMYEGLDRVLSELRARRQAPVNIVNVFKTRRRALQILWNPDDVTRDYWQLSVNVFGVNLVYFSI